MALVSRGLSVLAIVGHSTLVVRESAEDEETCTEMDVGDFQQDYLPTWLQQASCMLHRLYNCGGVRIRLSIYPMSI